MPVYDPLKTINIFRQLNNLIAWISIISVIHKLIVYQYNINKCVIYNVNISIHSISWLGFNVNSKLRIYFAGLLYYNKLQHVSYLLGIVDTQSYSNKNNRSVGYFLLHKPDR